MSAAAWRFPNGGTKRPWRRRKLSANSKPFRPWAPGRRRADPTPAFFARTALFHRPKSHVDLQHDIVQRVLLLLHLLGGEFPVAVEALVRLIQDGDGGD